MFNVKHFVLQVVLVYLQRLRCNSPLKYASLSEIAKKFTETPYCSSPRSFMVIDVVPQESSSPVLAMTAESLRLSATVLTIDELKR